MPSGLCLAEQRAYLALRILYAEYRKGNIERERASREKRKIVNQLEQEIKIDEVNAKIAQLWKNIEPYAKEYSLNPSVDTADKFYAAVYGLSKDWRLKR